MANMTINKDFNLVKAECCCLDYIKSRQPAKTEFIVELISLQHFFGETSIVDCKLGLCKRYRKKTVEDVLSNLGYKLVSFYYQTDFSLNGGETSTYSVITFTTADGD